MCHKRASRVTRALKAKAACNGYLGYGYFLCTLPKCVAELKTSTISMGKSLSHLKRPKYLELVLVKDSFKLPGFSVEATGKSDIKARIRGFAFCTNLISRPWHSPDTLRSCGFQEAAGQSGEAGGEGALWLAPASSDPNVETWRCHRATDARLTPRQRPNVPLCMLVYSGKKENKFQ